ncbi:MAG: DUF459 domain-containing protein [Planctomycetaceae bacterium]
MATGLETDHADERTPMTGTLEHPGRGRHGMAAGRVMIVMLTCLLVWGVLYAPELKRSSQAQPAGLRRTVSLAILSPVVWATDHVGITAVVDRAASALGRDPNAPVGGSIGGIPVQVDQVPSYSPGPSTSPAPEHPVRDTPIRDPSGSDPLRVAVVGDSLAAGIGYFAERVFKPFFVDVTKQGRISTGLARPDYFNWQQQMKYIVDRFHPDLTIVMLGENDRQSLMTPTGSLDTLFGTAWDAAYQRRVTRFAKMASTDGGHVVWVGLPIVRDQSIEPFNQRINAIFEQVAAKLPNVAYFDTADAFASPNGGYTAYYREGNKVILVRADDGIHFNADGYTLLMEQLARFVTKEWGLDPRTYGG